MVSFYYALVCETEADDNSRGGFTDASVSDAGGLIFRCSFGAVFYQPSEN